MQPLTSLTTVPLVAHAHEWNDGQKLSFLLQSLVTKIFSIFHGEAVFNKKLCFVQSAEIMRLTINGTKPLKLWLTKTWPHFVGTNVEWLAIRQAPHNALAKIISR